MRLSVAVAVVSLSIIGLAVADDVRASIRRPTNIPAQGLGPALQALAKDRNFQVVYVSEEVNSLRTHGAVGEFTSEEALKQLLNGTGMTYRYLDEKTVTIVRVAGSPAPPGSAPAPVGTVPVASTSDDSQKEGQKSFWDRFRLAEVDQGQTSSPSTVEKQDEQAARKKTIQLEEVIVTGSRIPPVAGQQVVPVHSYTRADIERSGQVTVADFLNTLPDVSIAYREDGFATGIRGVTTVRLHGLPVGTTLSLLDGRRLETSFLGFFDLSNIPSSAIERVEVLSVGRSAIYGADALAGAVNIILRKDFDGLEANGTWGHAAGVTDSGANLAWGKRWERGSVSLMGTYQDRGELLGSQREPTSSTNFPANAPTFAYFFGDCSPGNVFSLDGQNLPGLNSPQAAIPVGVTGAPTRQQFVATAGQQNQCNINRLFALLPATQREGALLSAHHAIAESMDLFTEVMFSQTDLRAQEGLLIDVPNYYSAVLAAGNPYNPFGQDVAVSFSYPGIVGPRERHTESLLRPLVGVRGPLFSDWHYEATAYLSRDHLDEQQPSVNLQNVFNALSSSNAATALNPFTTGAPGTPQLLQSLEAIDPNNSYHAKVVDRIVGEQGLLRGPLFSLPAGPLQAVVGGEYGQEKHETDAGYGTVVRTVLQRKTYALFTEARVPLLAEHGSQARERLTLTLAGRYDHSDDFGGKATWQGGLLWRATNTLSFNGGYGVSYKAPTLEEIDSPQITFTGNTGTVDPFRNNEPVSRAVTVEFGSNPKLNPETGDALTLGLTYSSQALRGLQTSLTYYDLKISNYISFHRSQDLINYPSAFPGAVIRAPATAQDQQQGFLGRIIQINQASYNFGDLHVAGFDADLSYAIETGAGRLTPSLALANIFKWQSALTPNSPAISYVSQVGGPQGWAPRWKGTAALAWQRGPLSINLAGRYVGPYKDYHFVPNSNQLGNSWFLDLNARYEAGQVLAATSPWLAHAYLAVGAVDLLDKTPPFSYGGQPWDASQYDIRGRFVYANVGSRF